MEQTSNYQLNLWEGEDRILREDFNADNAKIEAALANTGNCKIVTGSYVGTGKSGAAHPNEITVDFCPLMVFLDVTTTVNDSGIPLYYIFFRPAETGFVREDRYTNALTWSDHGLSWYSSGSNDSPRHQFNVANQTYHYIVIGV